MGVEQRSFSDSSTDLHRVGNELADWLVRQRGFTPTLNARLEDGHLLKMEKSDFGRQLTGLVYTLEITIQRQGSSVTVKVDDGDLRNQIGGLGIGALFFWPLLVTAGYGWVSKGQVRDEVIARAAQLLGAT